MGELSAKHREMLESLKDGPKLAGRWDFSRSRTPDLLRSLGFIQRCDHPTVIDRRTGYPADAYRITEKGRAALSDPRAPEKGT